MGRPVDLEKRARDQGAFLAAFAQRGNIKAAAAAAGIPHLAHYRWLTADAAYAERFAALEAETRELGRATRKPHSRGYRVRGARGQARLERQEAFLAALARTGILLDAAAEAGIHKGTYNYWVRTDPEFAERAARVQEDAEPIRQRIARQRASEANSAVWADPERREAQRERQRSAWTPEMREAAAQRNRDRMADPEFAAGWLEKSRESRKFAACNNPTYFDQIDTPDKAYWLGFIATDGCVTGFRSGSLRLKIKLARKDREHLVLLHKALQANRPIRDTEEWIKPPGSTERRRVPCSILDVCSPQIVNSLVGHGITQRKTNALQPWNGPEHLMPHYWRGVIDGDGTVILSADDFKVGLCGSEVLVRTFQAWARSICGTTANPRQGTKGNRQYWLLYIGGVNQVRRLLAALYDDAPVALARKKALADLAVHGKPLQASIF